MAGRQAQRELDEIINAGNGQKKYRRTVKDGHSQHSPKHKSSFPFSLLIDAHTDDILLFQSNIDRSCVATT